MKFGTEVYKVRGTLFPIFKKLNTRSSEGLRNHSQPLTSIVGFLANLLFKILLCEWPSKRVTNGL